MIKANSVTETEYHPRELLSSQVLLEPVSKIECEFRLNYSNLYLGFGHGYKAVCQFGLSGWQRGHVGCVR